MAFNGPYYETEDLILSERRFGPAFRRDLNSIVRYAHGPDYQHTGVIDSRHLGSRWTPIGYSVDKLSAIPDSSIYGSQSRRPVRDIQGQYVSITHLQRALVNQFWLLVEQFYL
jgi:hypothetical protein